ncbi:hypothetical protein RHRU231_870047 [Rhodococcus ruber]|uniref:Uncharacterized protein n=1 Tax=Rhodococcus ruber TaxID=1830 RepID=A0A098BSY3_9NOCA|nr:hypothetical protein RHRU231_870047 [Rhodococcus ruber]
MPARGPGHRGAGRCDRRARPRVGLHQHRRREGLRGGGRGSRQEPSGRPRRRGGGDPGSASGRAGLGGRPVPSRCGRAHGHGTGRPLPDPDRRVQDPEDDRAGSRGAAFARREGGLPVGEGDARERDRRRLTSSDEERPAPHSVPAVPGVRGGSATGAGEQLARLVAAVEHPGGASADPPPAVVLDEFEAVGRHAPDPEAVLVVAQQLRMAGGHGRVTLDPDVHGIEEVSASFVDVVLVRPCAHHLHDLLAAVHGAHVDVVDGVLGPQFAHRVGVAGIDGRAVGGDDLLDGDLVLEELDAGEEGPDEFCGVGLCGVGLCGVGHGVSCSDGSAGAKSSPRSVPSARRHSSCSQ